MHSVEETTHEGYPTLTLRSPKGLEATYAPSVGMVGCSLRHDGDELLGQRGGLARYEATGSTFGIPLLHPWANRLAGFDYEAAGKHVELDRTSPLLSFDPNGLPIHGLLAGSPHWRVQHAGATTDQVRIDAALDFGPAHPELLELFPFPHELRMQIALHDDALTVTTTLTPTADTPVPVSFGYHPYLALPNVPRAEWQVELPVTQRLILDEQMIPTGDTEPANEPRQQLNDRTFDDGYTRLPEPRIFAPEGGGRPPAPPFGPAHPPAPGFAPPGHD